MEELKNALRASAQAILNDIDNDTKAARRRVRKATLQVAKLGKDYRKASLETDKA